MINSHMLYQLSYQNFNYKNIERKGFEPLIFKIYLFSKQTFSTTQPPFLNTFYLGKDLNLQNLEPKSNVSTIFTTKTLAF